MQIKVGEYDVEVKLKDIKTMRITVKRDGSIVLSAPLKTSMRKILSFAQSEKGWIDKTIAKLKRTRGDALQKAIPREYVSGEEIYVFGKKRVLKVFKGEIDKVTLSDDCLTVILSGSTAKKPRKSAVIGFLEKQLQEYIWKKLPYFVAVTGLKPQSVTFKNIKSAWGKCYCQTGEILFAIQLATVDYSLIDYVIVHELCHLRVANHGKNFHKLLQRYVPEERKLKKLLKAQPCTYTTRV